jgi:lipoyl-dependent peroxiredoxin
MIEVVQIASAWALKQQSWQANARHRLTVEKERPISELAEASATAKREKLVYTAKTHTTGGRDGTSHSSDGRLDIKLSIPGAPGTGTYPEQLFAAGWSACFEGAMAVVARKRKISLPADTAIDADVDLNLILADGAYFLRARLNVSLTGVQRYIAQAIVDDAHQICPYSRATRDNIDVSIKLV